MSTRPVKLVSGQAAGLADAALGPPPDESGGREPVVVGSGPETIRVLAAQLDSGLLPETYCTDGRVVHIEKVSGSAAAGGVDEDAPLPLSATPLTPPLMARLLAHHAYVHKVERDKNRDEYPVEVSPPANVLAAVLAGKTWDGLPPLQGIVGAPVLRPDGSLLQRDGYDGRTGLYLARKVQLDPVPEQPTAEQVAEARHFLFDRLLGDFPWVEPADKANYLAMLATPVLRPYTRCLTPFGVVTATMPGSGKTILTAGVGMLYGQRVLTWTHSDEELRKAITSVLADSAGVIVFDNLAEGTVIDSPVLARLITERTWTDRLLGTNKASAVPNDRVWLATGNNLQVGGDIASRTVMVRLDPNMPNPEERTGFAIPDLDSWILEPANQRTVLWHLLVLILDWTAAGAPRKPPARAMRQFNPWAAALGGLLHHHGIPGFLANVDAVREVDEDATTWGAFLARWHVRFGPDWITAGSLRKQAEPDRDPVTGETDDPWDGTFPTDDRTGRLPTPKSLGRTLKGQIGRHRGHYVLRGHKDPALNMWVFRAEKTSEPSEKPGNPETR